MLPFGKFGYALAGYLAKNAKWQHGRTVPILFGGAVGVVLCTFADYGMSWDEPYAVVYGRNALAFFGSLGTDRTAVQGLVALRGAPFQILVEGVAAFAPDHALLIRRLLTPLVGLLGVAGTYRLAHSLAGRNAGLLAAALLLLTPIYYGHMFINPADMPFAVAYVWGLFFAARFAQEWPRPRTGSIAGAGIAIGLGTSMRIGGMLVLGYLLVLLLAHRLATASASAPTHRRPAGTRPVVAGGAGRLGALLAIAYCALLAPWPSALLSPLAVPWASLLQSAAYPKHEPVLLAGNVFWSDDLPWHYQLGHLLVQLPEQWLLAAALGAPVVTAGLFAALRRHDVARAAPAAMVLLGVAVPLLCACLLRPVDYDGMRHVLFVVPPIACLAAAGLCFALERLVLRPASCALLVAMLVGSSLRTLATMVELHPYQYVYYNALAGGTPGARGRFELDYWVTSFGEAMGELGALLAREPRAPGGPPQRLLVCGHAAVAYMYLPPDVVLSHDREQADFVLATTKWSCQDRYRGEVVAQVQRMGVPLAVVKRLRPPLVTATAAR
jgi:hypothetical protein